MFDALLRRPLRLKRMSCTTGAQPSSMARPVMAWHGHGMGSFHLFPQEKGSTGRQDQRPIQTKLNECGFTAMRARTQLVMQGLVQRQQRLQRPLLRAHGNQNNVPLQTAQIYTDDSPLKTDKSGRGCCCTRLQWRKGCACSQRDKRGGHH